MKEQDTGESPKVLGEFLADFNFASVAYESGFQDGYKKAKKEAVLQKSWTEIDRYRIKKKRGRPPVLASGRCLYPKYCGSKRGNLCTASGELPCKHRREFNQMEKKK